MSLEVQCPTCRARYQVGSRNTRTEFACVKCQTVIPIPPPDAVTSPQDPEPAPTGSSAPDETVAVAPPADVGDEYALDIGEPDFTGVAVAEETSTRRKKRKAAKRTIEEEEDDDRDERPPKRAANWGGLPDWVFEIPIPMYVCYAASCLLYAMALLNWFVLRDVPDTSVKGGAILRALVGSMVMIGLFMRMGPARRAEIGFAVLGGGLAVLMMNVNPLNDPVARMVFNVVLGVQLFLWTVEAVCLVLPSSREFFNDD